MVKNEKTIARLRRQSLFNKADKYKSKLSMSRHMGELRVGNKTKTSIALPNFSGLYQTLNRKFVMMNAGAYTTIQVGVESEILVCAEGIASLFSLHQREIP